MNLPIRITQHKSESDSFAILMYKLKDLGIFRNLTSNDYGIDLEIEITDGNKVIGKYFKAQVKSSRDLKKKADGTPTISGIKQSTLLYWTELSFYTHIIAFVVDLKTEQIYFSEPLFWQCLELLSRKEGKTKTIEFIENSSHNSAVLINNIRDKVFSPNVFEQIYTHKQLLKHINEIFEMYSMCAICDEGSSMQGNFESFKTLLEFAKLFLLKDLKYNSKELSRVRKSLNYSNGSRFYVLREITEEDFNEVLEIDYYHNNSFQDYPLINGKDALLAFVILMPKIGKKLNELRGIILNSKEYWVKKDSLYLEIVYLTNIPTQFDYKSINQYYRNSIKSKNKPNRLDFGIFIES